jgi:hypothetical protein
MKAAGRGDHVREPAMRVVCILRHKVPIFPHDPFRLTQARIVQCREKCGEDGLEERFLRLRPTARGSRQGNPGSSRMGVIHR